MTSAAFITFISGECIQLLLPGSQAVLEPPDLPGSNAPVASHGCPDTGAASVERDSRPHSTPSHVSFSLLHVFAAPAAIDASKQRQKAEKERMERQREQQRRTLTRHSMQDAASGHNNHSLQRSSSSGLNSSSTASRHVSCQADRILRPLRRHSAGAAHSGVTTSAARHPGTISSTFGTGTPAVCVAECAAGHSIRTASSTEASLLPTTNTTTTV